MKALRLLFPLLAFAVVLFNSIAGGAARLPWDGGAKSRSQGFMQPTLDLVNKIHNAEDYPLVNGSTLYALETGTIKYFKDTDPQGYDNSIIIEYPNYAVMYLHLAYGSIVSSNPTLFNNVPQGEVVQVIGAGKPVALSACDHVHIEMGASRESFMSSSWAELIRPSSKFPSWIPACYSHTAPTIFNVAGYPSAPVGSSVPVWVGAMVTDPGYADTLIPNRFEVFCNGSSWQTLTFDKYSKDDFWVQGKEVGYFGDERWYLKMNYTISPLEGPNYAYIVVSDECGLTTRHDWTTVDVNDISSFAVSGNGYQVAQLAWNIIDGYTVTEVDIYRSTNPLGPYDKVTSMPIPITHAGVYSFIDTYEYAMNYYYKIFAAGPGSGYKEASPFPVYLDMGAFPPLEPQPASSLTASDIAMDDGRKIALSWQLSPSEPAAVERYDIYRGNHGSFLYYASVSQGTSAFIDTNAVENNEFCYKVVAHNGINGSSYSNEACATAIDDFEFIAASVHSDEYECAALRLCPMGDYDTLRVHAKILGSNHIGTAGVNAEDIALEINADPDQIILCDGNGVSAPYDSDDNGEVILEYPYIGGCGQIMCSVNSMDTLSCAGIPVDIKSPDLTHNGAVNLSDIIVFNSSYNWNYPDPGFNSCCDFNCDNKCNLIDFATMGTHYQHIHGYGMQQLSAVLEASDMGVVLETGESDEIGYSRVTLAFENAQGISVVALALNIDSDEYEFVSWEKEPSFSKETIVCPVENSGIRTLMIVCYGEEAITNGITRVGEIRFKGVNTRYNMSESIESSGLITLTAGEVMDENGEVTMINSVRRRSKEQVRSTYLGENYPNPFNPQTTIEYSIDKAQYVELGVYDLTGKRVQQLVEGVLPAGVHRAMWDGKNDNGKQVASGIYFYRLKAGSFVKSNKMILLR